jgi:hypothetical protein
MAARAPKLFEPWVAPKPSLFEAASVKAVAEGTATAEQQRECMAYIIKRVCGTYEEQFCPGEEGRRNTDYALGKRRVGLHLVSLLSVDLKNFKDE